MQSLFDVCASEAQDIVNVPHAFLGANAVGLQQPGMLDPSTMLRPTLNDMKPLSHAQNSATLMYPQQGNLVDLGGNDVPGLIGMAQMNAGSMFQAMAPVGEDHEQLLDRDKLEELLHTLAANKFRKKRRGKMGSGKHLTYKDLAKHFGVGLKEAAATLGICPTTLKRACRRNGIERWPSRHATKSSEKPKDDCAVTALKQDPTQPEKSPSMVIGLSRLSSCELVEGSR